MLTIKWVQMGEILPGVRSLASSPKVDRVISHRAGRIAQAINSNQAKAQKAYNAIVEKYAKRDEKLNVVRDDGGNIIFADEESGKKCNAEIEMLGDTLFEVKVFGIPFDGVREHLTGQQLAGMETVLEGVPDEA